jgi:hypothetical protein
MGAVNLMGGASGSGGVLSQLCGSGTKGAAGYNPGLFNTIGNYFSSPSSAVDGWQTSGDNTYFGDNSSGTGAGEGYSGMNEELGLE